MDVGAARSQTFRRGVQVPGGYWGNEGTKGGFAARGVTWDEEDALCCWRVMLAWRD